MAFRLDPSVAIQDEVQRVARARLDDALARLGGLADADAAEIETAVHETRKRCKEVRALARLVRGSLGPGHRVFDRRVRDAARQLSSIRDAHALLETFDELRASEWTDANGRLELVREHQAELATAASSTLAGGDPRIAEAARLLTKARRKVRRWEVPDDVEALADGLASSYERGQRSLDQARTDPTDDHLHDYRKAVKTLWYQLRLLRDAAPDALDPPIAQLDTLSDLLGEDHDLAVLADAVAADRKGYGGKKATGLVSDLARARQRELREEAFGIGMDLYAEPSRAFVSRIRSCWELAAGPRTHSVERERKFLVEEVPDLPPSGNRLRQGYLALDRDVAVRVRDAGDRGCTLTVKAGRGPVRTELEWPISRDEFDAAWDLTEGRRVTKIRYEITDGDATVELDVFDDELAGLVIAEVEFESDAELEAFEAPAWFGREVTDDDRYTNASLAVVGLDTGDLG